MSENYRVGQILYVIPAEDAKVVPVKILERRISETESGSSIWHIVKTPAPKAANLRLETIKGLVFADLQEARRVMLKNAQSAIDNMINHAANIAQQVFGPQGQTTAMIQHEQHEQQVDIDPFDTSDILVDVPEPMNGSIPTMPQAIPVPQQAQPQPQPQQPSVRGTEVVLEDGRKVKLA